MQAKPRSALEQRCWSCTCGGGGRACRLRRGIWRCGARLRPEPAGCELLRRAFDAARRPYPTTSSTRSRLQAAPCLATSLPSRDAATSSSRGGRPRCRLGRRRTVVAAARRARAGAACWCAPLTQWMEETCKRRLERRGSANDVGFVLRDNFSANKPPQSFSSRELRLRHT